MELSKNTKEIIGMMFDSVHSVNVMTILLGQCTVSIAGCQGWSLENFERVWISVLKLSDGDIEKLESAVSLANTDYRDLFMAAGFGYDTEAHKKWRP